MERHDMKAMPVRDTARVRHIVSVIVIVLAAVALQ
jgi:hypothetical protein